MENVTTIQIQTQTREQLKSMGHKGESYDELINRLIKSAKKSKFFEEIDTILETEEFVSLDKI
jgi:predicted CopG family antitoxin